MNPHQILDSLCTFAGTNFMIVSANGKLDQKKADFKKKETESYKVLSTLQALAKVKTSDIQDQLIAQLPEKDQNAFRQSGTSTDRRRLMCRSRINRYQMQDQAFKSAQSLMEKEKELNSKVGFATSLTFAIFHGYCALKG
jgi:hypothetical protein